MIAFINQINSTKMSKKNNDMITTEWLIVNFQVLIFHFQPAHKFPQ